ncbi:MAG: glycine zipper 2TM domain-containing protein [Sulfurimonas sp.]|uniref:glycine zipper 2TM domain-containing protein n=1 Tax=Sulfurimonas sp. TaxID=2022749 RepID=UPI002631085E|nr:glycine zipper 2TM domain-containing protein [Sulfurimonas sp.]MCW8894495.1 glycine zipper 2TM domain-containing protein [Sulfurimonas sp.]MCW8954112.1 glycine zipper 2TM domain-containing protein [Sulfurimonas sp.]MCW9067756.1 glycine zipper 2TM domain-containing protein [Sulfurimonas sp.]
MKYIISLLAASLLIFSGCSTNVGPEYDGQNYKQIKKYEIGTVTKSRPIVITDDGSGKFVGTLVGAVLGSMIGSNRGKILAMLGGGLGGHYVGAELGKANGEELSVELDNKEEVVIVLKGNRFFAGDRIKIIRDGDKVAQVEKLTK